MAWRDVVYHHATLRYAMLCYAMLCYAMLCYAMLCHAVAINDPRPAPVDHMLGNSLGCDAINQLIDCMPAMVIHKGLNAATALVSNEPASKRAALLAAVPLQASLCIVRHET